MVKRMLLGLLLGFLFVSFTYAGNCATCKNHYQPPIRTMELRTITPNPYILYVQPRIEIILPRPLGYHVHNGLVYHSLHLSKTKHPINTRIQTFKPYW